jgi:thiol-disulfide isomerase/thioredoxin
MNRRVLLTSTVLTLALVVLAPAPKVARAGDDALLTFSEAQKRATEQELPLLVDFFADWCAPCKAFDRDRAASAELKDALGQVVFTSIDAEKGEGVELAETYEIHGYPTYVLMTASGEVIDRWSGYGDPEGFVETLGGALADPTTLDEKAKRFERAPTASDAKVLGRIAESKSDYTGALDYYRRAAKLDPSDDLSTHIFWSSYYEYTRGKTLTAEDLKAAADAVLASENANAPVVVNLAMTMNRVATKEHNPELRTPYLEAAVEALDKDESIPPPVQKEVELLAALHLERDEAVAVQLKKETMPEGWMEDAGQLNGFAWWCFENQLNLEEAEKLGRRGVELASPGREKAMVLDTVAEICNLRGDCRDAVTLIELALQEDSENDYYQKQLERFQKLLAASE